MTIISNYQGGGNNNPCSHAQPPGHLLFSLTSITKQRRLQFAPHGLYSTGSCKACIAGHPYKCIVKSDIKSYDIQHTAISVFKIFKLKAMLYDAKLVKSNIYCLTLNPIAIQYYKKIF